MTLEEFIVKANKKHNNKFDYSEAVQFKSRLDKVTIICPKGHKNDVQVGNHLGGSDVQNVEIKNPPKISLMMNLKFLMTMIIH